MLALVQRGLAYLERTIFMYFDGGVGYNQISQKGCAYLTVAHWPELAILNLCFNILNIRQEQARRERVTLPCE